MKHFLLVDDDEIFAHLLQRGFGRHGLTLDWAANSDAALAYQGQPDGIILDLNLGGDSGLPRKPEAAHRLDKDTSGCLVLGRHPRAMAELNQMFRDGRIGKTYWAIVKNCPPAEEGELVNWLVRNEKQNKSYAYDKEVPNSKKAILHYRLIARSQNYYLLEIDLKTGRHHQIRCQLAKMGCPIKGDLKYGSPRSNPDGSICLHARFVRFVHPVSKKLIEVEAPVPAGNLWNGFEMV